MRGALLGVGALGLAACEPRTALEGVELESATLTDLGVFYAGVLVGVEVGEARLDVLTADGDELEVPVTLSGPRLGLVVELAFGVGIMDFELMPDIDVRDDDDVFQGEDCFGTYTGTEYAFSLLAGVHVAVLTNEAGTALPLGTATIGAAGGLDWVSVTMEPKVEP